MTELINYLPKQTVVRLKTNHDALFVDVRTEAENNFVGRPTDIFLAPWVNEPDWEPNPKAFVATLKKLVTNKKDSINTEIILLCRSGYRSNDAGNCLIENGFTNVAHVSSGFEGDLDDNSQRGNINGWRYDGLPWIQG